MLQRSCNVQPFASTRKPVLSRCTVVLKASSLKHKSTCEVGDAPVESRAKLLCLVASAWSSRQQMQLPTPASPQDLRSQMAQHGSSCMAAVLPFAASTVVGGAAAGNLGMGELCGALGKGIDIYLFILTIRVLLTWFRNINWYSEPFRTLRTLTDPALNACRGIIPAIGGMDLSPMLLFFGLNFAAKQLKILAATL